MTSALRGKRIVNTRAAHQAESLNQLLRARGAQPLDYPCIAILPPEDTTELDAAVRELAAGCYSWLVLTSTNTVMILAQRISALGLSLNVKSFSTAAVGSITAQAADEMLGLRVTYVPERFVAESLAESLPITASARVLLPESAIARPMLADILRARGAEVRVIQAYRTMKGSGGVEVPALLSAKQIDAVIFTSSSTVTYFVERLREEAGSLGDLDTVCLACIGHKTAETARGIGLQVAAVPQEHTLEGLVGALEQYFVCSRVSTGIEQ